MSSSIKKFLQKFRRDEDGAVAVIEFVILFPLIIGIFTMSVEMGIYSMRHMFLDRGLDIAVRYVRLNTNTPLTHTQLKDMVCENAGFIENCGDTMRLEMVSVNPRNFSQLDPEGDCVDLGQPIQAERGFDLGREHEIMFIRACVKFDPVFPTTGLGKAFTQDSQGKVAMMSSAAFVQEPN